jgi:hypothetical protein
MAQSRHVSNAQQAHALTLMMRAGAQDDMNFIVTTLKDNDSLKIFVARQLREGSLQKALDASDRASNTTFPKILRYMCQLAPKYMRDLMSKVPVGRVVFVVKVFETAKLSPNETKMFFMFLFWIEDRTWLPDKCSARSVELLIEWFRSGKCWPRGLPNYVVEAASTKEKLKACAKFGLGFGFYIVGPHTGLLGNEVAMREQYAMCEDVAMLLKVQIPVSADAPPADLCLETNWKADCILKSESEGIQLNLRQRFLKVHGAAKVEGFLPPSFKSLEADGSVPENLRERIPKRRRDEGAEGEEVAEEEDE